MNSKLVFLKNLFYKYLDPVRNLMYNITKFIPLDIIDYLTGFIRKKTCASGVRVIGQPR